MSDVELAALATPTRLIGEAEYRRLLELLFGSEDKDEDTQ